MKFIKSYEKINCDNIMKCAFDLNKSDIEVYKKLIENGKVRVEDIACKLEKDRSTVYRSLQKLVSCGICVKEIKTIEKGGYYHVYSCNDIKKVKEKMKKCIDDWYQHMKDVITRFEKEMR